jgi:tripartite-type tricarboxylate transporter receptor subunit TctC
VEMKVDRRSFLIGSAASATALPWALAHEAYPTRAITIINPFPPGGASVPGTTPSSLRD